MRANPERTSRRPCAAPLTPRARAACSRVLARRPGPAAAGLQARGYHDGHRASRQLDLLVVEARVGELLLRLLPPRKFVHGHALRRARAARPRSRKHASPLRQVRGCRVVCCVPPTTRTAVSSWGCSSTPALPPMSPGPSRVRGWPPPRRGHLRPRPGLGRGTLELDFRVSASPPPADLNRVILDPLSSGTVLAGRRVRLTVADISAFCGNRFDDTRPHKQPRLLRHQRGQAGRQRRPLRGKATTPVPLRTPKSPRTRHCTAGLHRRSRPSRHPKNPRGRRSTTCPRRLRASRREHPPRGRARSPAPEMPVRL